MFTVHLERESSKQIESYRQIISASLEAVSIETMMTERNKGEVMNNIVSTFETSQFKR